MLNKCELRQEHISSFQEPKRKKNQLKQNRQIILRTWCNSCKWLEDSLLSQNYALALPSPLPLQADPKLAAETSQLFFFCVPSAWEAGQGPSPGLWPSLYLSRVVVLLLYIGCKYWLIGFHTGMKAKMFTKQEDLATTLTNGQCKSEMNISFTSIPRQRDLEPYSTRQHGKHRGLQSNEIRLSQAHLYHTQKAASSRWTEQSPFTRPQFSLRTLSL